MGKRVIGETGAINDRKIDNVTAMYIYTQLLERYARHIPRVLSDRFNGKFSGRRTGTGNSAGDTDARYILFYRINPSCRLSTQLIVQSIKFHRPIGWKRPNLKDSGARRALLGLQRPICIRVEIHPQLQVSH